MMILNMFSQKVLTLMLGVFALGFFSAQENPKEWKDMTTEERKEYIKNMSPEERQKTFINLRDNAVVSDLNIPKDHEEEFKTLFEDYQKSQRDIKVKFTPREDYDKMSPEEAKKQLNKSFEVGQQLLENRKKYAEKMQQLIPPQQVLKMFNNEGRMRGRMMEKAPARPNTQQAPMRTNNVRTAPSGRR